MATKNLNAPAAPAAVAEPVPMAEPEGGWPADEFTGLGGSFVRDPYTGIRRPAEPEVGAAEPEQAPV